MNADVVLLSNLHIWLGFFRFSQWCPLGQRKTLADLSCHISFLFAVSSSPWVCVSYNIHLFGKFWSSVLQHAQFRMICYPPTIQFGCAFLVGRPQSHVLSHSVLIRRRLMSMGAITGVNLAWLTWTLPAFSTVKYSFLPFEMSIFREDALRPRKDLVASPTPPSSVHWWFLSE